MSVTSSFCSVCSPSGVRMHGDRFEARRRRFARTPRLCPYGIRLISDAASLLLTAPQTHACLPTSTGMHEYIITRRSISSHDVRTFSGGPRRGSNLLHQRTPLHSGRRLMRVGIQPAHHLARRPLAPAGGPPHPRDRREEKKKLEGLMRESTTLHHRTTHNTGRRLMHAGLKPPHHLAQPSENTGGTKAWEQPATPTHPPTLWTAADACGHTASTPPRAPSPRPRGGTTPPAGQARREEETWGADA
eukprot:scaffold754_cov130-Isochrysis_galbana.AAC.1